LILWQQGFTLQSVKRRIIKALSIGGGITAFGFALFFISLLFFPDHFDHSKPAIFENFFTVLMTAIFFPGKVLSFYFGDVCVASLLILTAFFWAGVAFFLIQVKQNKNQPQPISTR